MKILRIYTRLPPMPGGMEKHIYNLTLEQIKLGHDVRVYFNKGSKITKNDVQISTLPLDSTNPRFTGIILFHFFILIRIFLKRENYDIVHIHGDWSSLVFAKLIQHFSSAKALVFSVHDDINETFVYNHVLSILLKQVDIVFSTGYKAANKIKKIVKTSIFVQPSGINEFFFKPYTKIKKNHKFQVITVANLIPKKNLNLVLDIAKEFKYINFIIVGEGSEKKKLQNRLKNESIKNVKLLGFKSATHIKELLFQSDLFLLTSTKEGTPTAILEAMACGLPIVTSKVGGIENIIKNGINGFVIDSYLKQDYIYVLIKCQAYFLENIGEQNFHHSKNYTWGKATSNITDKCKLLIKGK